MKVKELIDLLSKEDPEADVCIDGPESAYNVNAIENTTVQETKVVAIVADMPFYGFPDPDNDIKKLINMRSDWTDHWGEDLLWTVMYSMKHGDRRFPQE